MESLTDFFIKTDALALPRKLQYKPREAALIVGVTPETLRIWAALGDISHISIGRNKKHKRIYYSAEGLVQFLARNRKEPNHAQF